MTVDQIDLGLTRVAQTIQTARNEFNAGVASILKSDATLASLPTNELVLKKAIDALPSGVGLNDERKAKLSEYFGIFQALKPPISTTAGNLESIEGL